MVLSIRNILQELPEVFSGSSIHSHFTDDLIDYTILFDSAAPCQERVLYVAKEAQIAQAYANESFEKPGALRLSRLSFAILGRPSDELLSDERFDIIYAEKDLSLFAFFNLIQDVFVTYSEWVTSLSEIAISRGSLKDLVNASLEIIKNDIWLTEQYSKVILHRVYKNIRLTEEQLAEVKEGEYLPKRMIADGEEEEAEGRDFSTPGAQFFPLRAHKSMSLYNTFYTRGNYRMGLAFEANYREVTEGDYIKSLILGSYIQSLYSNAEVFGSSEFDFNDTALLKESLGGAVTDRARLRSALQVLGWDIGNDWLVCLAFCYYNPSLGKSRRDVQPEVATVGLLKDFCTCRAFVFENRVFALVNLDKNPMSFEEFLGRLPEEIMKGNMSCGISDVFKDLEEVRGRYRQAVVTLESCKGKSSEEKAVCYTEVMLDVTFDWVKQNMPLSYYVPKELLDLIERDSKCHSRLYDTLKTYLNNNCSIAETCRQLFLQRNGAVYRLGKAKDLLPSFDINDAKDRLKLMLSMEIIDEELLSEMPQ